MSSINNHMATARLGAVNRSWNRGIYDTFNNKHWTKLNKCNLLPDWSPAARVSCPASLIIGLTPFEKVKDDSDSILCRVD